MIQGKVCYIHARETNEETGQLNHLGGVTIAWVVDAEGNIRVGQPARCRPNERFIKKDGRREAYTNLETKELLAFIAGADLSVAAASQSILAMNYSVLTPAARADIMETAIERCYTNLVGTMSSTWFEQQVRSRLVFGNNDVAYAPEVAEFSAKIVDQRCLAVMQEIHQFV